MMENERKGKRKKILYVHHGGAQGGAPRSLSFLIEKLDKSRYEPYVLNFFDYIENEKIFESVGAKTIEGKFMGPWHGSTVCPVNLKVFILNLAYLIPTYIKMRKILSEIEPDIVHLNSTCLCFVAMAIKHKNKRLPIVCHVREPLQKGMWGDIIRNVCNRYVDEYVAIEKYDADSLRTKKPISVIYNFIDFKQYNNSIKSDCLRKELNLTKDDKILLYLARICSQNGAYELVSSIKNLFESRKDIHLVIVGAYENMKSEYFDQLQNLCSNYPENIHILSFRKDVPQVIASCEIMVVPFQEPHFARSVIEAYAIGKPVLASNVEGLNELVIEGKTGYMFNPKTFEGFEEKCQYLLDNPEVYEKMSQDAIEFALLNFDANINANRTFEIYERIEEKFLSKA